MEHEVKGLTVVWDVNSKTGVFRFSTDENAKSEIKVNNAAEFTAALLLLSQPDVKWDDKAKKLFTGSKPAEW